MFQEKSTKLIFSNIPLKEKKKHLGEY
jgi:hypothetical protein